MRRARRPQRIVGMHEKTHRPMVTLGAVMMILGGAINSLTARRPREP